MRLPSPLVTIHALTIEAFSPFGEIVAPHGEGRVVNQGEALRHDHVAALADLRRNAAPNLAVFEVRRGKRPLTVKWLERHPHSTQAFLPLSSGRFVVTVAPNASSGDAPDGAKACAYLASSGVGITYHPGIWHHGLIPLDGAMRFAMLVWEDGSAGDCEIVDTEPPLILDSAGLV